MNVDDAAGSSGNFESEGVGFLVVVVFSAGDACAGGEVDVLSGIGFDDSFLVDDDLDGVVVTEFDGSDEPDVGFSCSCASVLDSVSGRSTSAVVVDVIDLVEMDDGVIPVESEI